MNKLFNIYVISISYIDLKRMFGKHFLNKKILFNKNVKRLFK